MAEQNQSRDDTNTPVRTLAGSAIVSAIVGVVLVIVGVPGSGSASTNYGSALLSFAFLMWILLLVFWGWRWERRTYPTADSYALPTARSIAAAIQAANLAEAPGAPPPSPGMNRMQREAAARAAAERVVTSSEEG